VNDEPPTWAEWVLILVLTTIALTATGWVFVTKLAPGNG